MPLKWGTYSPLGQEGSNNEHYQFVLLVKRNFVEAQLKFGQKPSDAFLIVCVFRVFFC